MEINYQLTDLNCVTTQVIQHLKSKTILLYGEMGVGKTTFVKNLVKELGSNDTVSSPTFSIANEYALENDKIFHFDLYRIKTLEEAYNFGIEDYLDSNHWILVEWPDVIKPILHSPFDIINLELNLDNSRTLILK